MIINGQRPFKQRTRQGLTIAPLRSGRFVLRAKSSLSATRVKTDPAFKPLMADAALMKLASPLASVVYRSLGIKDVKLYRNLVGRVKRMLKDGLETAIIKRQLQDEILNKKRKVKIGRNVILRVARYRDFPVFFVEKLRFFDSLTHPYASVFNTS
ncbi:hypothetical protein [Chitinophaga sp.]|uniref:hypothetical protein n=1 Tax=Chitinophaga sp. TaxID=1869181 RepID=UPI0031D13D57